MSANKANYTTIGLTVVVGTLAIIGTLVYLGGAGSREERVYAETFSDKSVSGLSVGSAVNFRGVKVGEVAEISFVGNKYEGVTPMDARRIYILMSFRKEDLGFYVGKADQLVRSGMLASRELFGFRDEGDGPDQQDRHRGGMEQHTVVRGFIRDGGGRSRNDNRLLPRRHRADAERLHRNRVIAQDHSF